jgi:hypothetical protein
MKTTNGFLRALRSKPIYAGGFSDRENVFNLFEKNEDPDIVILYANYEDEGYDGFATVVYYRKSTKKYYEVYGSHCSCYGLEGQWDKDEEVVAKELLKRLDILGRMWKEYQEK